MRCSAKSKRSGERCKRAATPGSAVCRMHGSRSLKGAASPAFRDGRYSRLLPGGLSQAYERSRNDPNLLSLRDEVAVLDSRLAELVGKLDSLESASLWKRLRETAAEVHSAYLSEDAQRLAAGLTEIDVLVKAGAESAEVWREIERLVDARRKLVAGESQRLVAMEAMLSTEQAVALVRSVYSACAQEIADPTVLNRVGDRLRALTARPAVEN